MTNEIPQCIHIPDGSVVVSGELFDMACAAIAERDKLLAEIELLRDQRDSNLAKEVEQTERLKAGMTKLRRCRVYSVSDGGGHFDQMDEYSERGEYYYADDVDAEIQRLRAALRILTNGNKYSAEVCNIARGALAQSAHEPEKQA